MHDSEEYGVLRWPLKDIALAVNCRLPELRSLAFKDVLKGGEESIADLIYVPRHAGKDGDPVVLLPGQGGPIWFSSRMVRDEYVRSIRGEGTRFGEQNPPPKATPNATPKPPIGDGASTSSSSSTSSKSKTKTPFPENFVISDRIREWASSNGHSRLEERLEHFAGYARANGKTYADWEQGFMNAIRGDWAKISGPRAPDYSAMIETLEDGV